MKSLVLAEKPSVGRELARVLGCKKRCEGYIEGDRYIVTWSLGHLITLADPESYDDKYKRWSLDYLPMLPKQMKLTVIKNTSSQFKVVNALMKRKDISELIIATDSGREGELVARWIMMKGAWKGRTRRLWISSQTDKAIKDGFAALKDAREYDNLFRSAQARSHADWIVGLNVTRALTCRFNTSLSAGRVQTPTLALIVEREKAIKGFVSKEYFTVAARTKDFEATYKDKKGVSRLFDRAEADGIAARVKGKQGVISSLTSELKQTAPPAAYDLTELQRDANKKYGFSAKETLSVMQSLYERHKVLTYPRTDSRYITEDVAATLPDRLRSLLQTAHAETAKKLLREPKLNTKYIVNSAKVTDHHAIIPTEQRPDFSDMSSAERSIYDLVARRFLAVLMTPFKYEETKIVFTVDGLDFHAKGKVVKDTGWKSVYGTNIVDDEDDTDDDDRAQSLPPLKKGEREEVLSVKVGSGRTKPPARYTEATLLSAMEHPTVSDRTLSKVLSDTSGLGTPATRADIIEKLFSAFYVERQGKELIPTAKGIQLISLVPSDLKSAVLTAKWEERLALISQGRSSADAFVKDMQDYATKLVTEVKGSDKKYVHENATKEKCPECGEPLLDVKGKKGRLYVCSNAECRYRQTIEVDTRARCPECHKTMTLRGAGEKKQFACVCGYREKLSDFEARKKDEGASNFEVKRFMQEQQKEETKGINDALAKQLELWRKGTGGQK